MARLRLFPHRTAAVESVAFGDWFIERDGSSQRLPSLLSGWDYAREELVGLEVTVDEELLLASTGLEDLADIKVLLLGDCRNSQRRITRLHPLPSDCSGEPLRFDLSLPSGELAGSVALSAALVLGRDLPTSSARAPHLRGSRLISSRSTTVVLEGEDSRFPIEPVAFSKIFLTDAPWTLHMSYDSLDANFMGGVRLLVNLEHPVGQMLLHSESAERVSGIAMADIIRLLVASMADEIDQLRDGEHPEGSIAHVIDSMCSVFLGRGLLAALELYTKEPLQFDRLVHERVKPLARMFE